MPDRILPPLLVLLEIRELSGDVGVDLAEGRPLLRAVLYRHGDQGDVAEGRFAVRSGGTTVGAVIRAGRDGGRGAVGGGRGGRGGCGRRGGIAIGRAVKGTDGRRALVVQVMVRRAGGGGGGGVHGDHRAGAMQTVMGMMVMVVVTQGCDVMRRQTAAQAAGYRRGVEVLRIAADAAALQLGHETAH